MVNQFELRSAARATPSGDSNAVGTSGDWRSDSIIQGSKWQGSTALTYSLWDNVFDIWNMKNVPSLYKWDDAKRAVVREAFDAYSAFTNLTFTYENTNGARSTTSDIEIMGTGFIQQFTIGSIGLGVFPNKSFGDQWLQLLGVNRNTYPNVEGSIYLDNYADVFKYQQDGGRGLWVLLHEIGHTLGLKHTHDDGGNERPTLKDLGKESFDNTLYSMMSYKPVEGSTKQLGNIATPMVHDILALQRIYGENWNYHNGDDTYTLKNDMIVRAVWDGGGRDMWDASGSDKAATLTLAQGGYSKIGDTYQAIAYKVVIEDAKGTAYADSITGNEVANVLYGNASGDTIKGGDGADTIYGGAGRADPNDGSDVICGDGGADHICGNAGNDTIYGGTGSGDASDAGDTIYGGLGADAIYGNGGDDTIYGGGARMDTLDGADDIVGGAGNDALYGNAGDDTLSGGAGNDSLHGGLGDDVYVITSDGSSDIILFFEGEGALGGDVLEIEGFGLTVDQILADTTYTAGGAVIDLGSLTLTIAGITTLAEDDFFSVT